MLDTVRLASAATLRPLRPAMLCKTSRSCCEVMDLMGKSPKTTSTVRSSMRRRRLRVASSQARLVSQPSATVVSVVDDSCRSVATNLFRSCSGQRPCRTRPRTRTRSTRASARVRKPTACRERAPLSTDDGLATYSPSVKSCSTCWPPRAPPRSEVARTCGWMVARRGRTHGHLSVDRFRTAFGLTAGHVPEQRSSSKCYPADKRAGRGVSRSLTRFALRCEEVP